MDDETSPRPSEASDGGGYFEGSGGESAPLQSRADFLENWSWASVAEINSGLCKRGGAQSGINSETHEKVAEEWEARRKSELTLLETLQFLKSCHRRAPFLFFNGNTFAEIGRTLANVLFSDLPLQRSKAAASVTAHFVTGVLDLEILVSAINSLSQTASFQVGDKVKTLKGSLHGTILRVLEDGRLVWKADGGTLEMTGLPESLVSDD